jgi:hypothetical protein
MSANKEDKAKKMVDRPTLLGSFLFEEVIWVEARSSFCGAPLPGMDWRIDYGPTLKLDFFTA